jgi:hypothetical protein
MSKIRKNKNKQLTGFEQLVKKKEVSKEKKLKKLQKSDQDGAQMSLLYRKMKNQMEQKYIEKDKKNLFDIESEDEVI